MNTPRFPTWLLISFFLLATTSSVATTLPSKTVSQVNQHQHKTALGVHGMALMAGKGILIASHMPLHNSIHNHQLVFELSIKNRAHKTLIQNSLSHHLVTIAPKPFDLIKLMTGELTSFSAEVYQGHFEREGIKIATNVTIEVNKVILNQPLTSANNGTFYTRHISDSEYLLIHQIAQAPSFDQIFLISDSEAQHEQLNFKTNAPISEQTVKDKLTNSSKSSVSVKLLYLETQDFTH